MPDAQQHDHADHEHDHTDHEHDHAWWERLPFLHQHGEQPVDGALQSATGSRALWQSLVLLALTAAFQLSIALASHSTSLLADTIHNGSDALTALPLLLAFALARRPPTRRYTYGYGRAEDLAGLLIVLIIAASAVLAAVVSVQKLLHPQPITQVGWVTLAAVVGFLGNEAVAQLRIRTGTAIGSAALVADGQHARADGFTSLAVLLGVGGSLLGWPLVDPIVGLLITVAILAIVRESALAVWGRVMDAVDPSVVETILTTTRAVPGVAAVPGVRVRWLGHELVGEVQIAVAPELATAASAAIGDAVRHALQHALPRLTSVAVEIRPAGHLTSASHHPGALPAVS